jgi:transcriptional regulator with XRE-family HTH domain
MYKCFVTTRFEALGAFLRSLREAKNFSTYDLAKRSGLTASAVSKIERGEIQNPGIETLYLIAKALNTPLESLVKAYQGIDQAKPPEAIMIEEEAERAVEFFSRFIRKDKK